MKVVLGAVAVFIVLALAYYMFFRGTPLPLSDIAVIAGGVAFIAIVFYWFWSKI